MALQTIRSHSRGWVAIVLFFFLILAFGVWGIEDMIRQGVSRSGPVITVGSDTIDAQELQVFYQRMIRNFEERDKRGYDYETAKSRGYVAELIAQLQENRIWAQEARAKRVHVSDAWVQRRLRNERGVDDRSDREFFKGEYARLILIGGLAEFEGSPPKALADKLFTYRSEFRSGEVLTVPFSAMKPPEPTEEQLKGFHQANAAARYTAPEYRSLTLLLVRPEDAAERVEVSEQDLRDEYAKRKGDFTTPETRALRQIIFTDEAAAKQAYEALVGGRKFDVVAKEFAKRAPDDLGTMSASQLVVPELRDVVFKLKVDEVSAPIKSALGWHIVRVDKINPMVVKPFEEAKAEVEKAIRTKKSVKLLAELREKVDDAFGEGLKTEGVAEKLNLKVAKIGPIDGEGKDEKGATAEGLPDDRDFLRRIFRQSKASEGDVVDMRNHGFFSARIDAIIPKQVKPFDSVKAQVNEDWLAAERAKMAEVEATKLSAEAKAGKSLADIAKPANYTVQQTKPVDRGDALSAEPGSVGDRLFAIAVGEVVVVKVQNGYAVLKVLAAKDERSEGDRKQAREQFEKAVRDSFGRDLAASYLNALRVKYPTRVEQETIDRFLGGPRR
jgi:peptidyl-prolyl cis-trans isomerase D